MKSPSILHFKVAVIACGITTLIVSPTARAQSASFTVQTYPIIGNTQIAADFNGDGKPDLAGGGLNAASVRLNNGDGTFGPQTDFPVGAQTQDVAAGDLNGDGKTDLVVTLNTPQLSLALLLGTGTGTFGAPTFFPNTSGFDSPAVIATDLNNDGKLDVVIMHNIACFTAPCRAARSVTVMLGNGDGTLQPAREIDVNTFPHSMTIGDFNRDGIKDLAVGGENTELSILLGVGDGTFLQKPIMLLVPGGDLFSACNDVDVADFNRDGIQDITVPLGNGNGNAIVLGNGDGTFRVSVRILTDAVSAPQSDAVADYNGDSFVDIARGMGDGTRGLMQIMQGNGDGTFQPPGNYAVPAPMSSVGGGYIISADFNGDGKPDIALQVRGNDAATDVLVNTSGAAVPTISTLTLRPSSVTGGSAATGTVTLSARALTATTISLASDSAAASVPASVTVAAGATTGNFSINTTQVSTATSAQITASLNTTSRVATLTISATAPVTDTVSITRAEYDSAKRMLRVEATSSRSTATLQVFVTSANQLIGNLTNNGGGRYGGQFTWSANPQNITVRSNFGGSASRAVTAK